MTTCPSSTCERAIPLASPRLRRGSMQACGPLTSTIGGLREHSTQYVHSRRFRRALVIHGAASVTSCFGSALLSTPCSRKASLCLRSGPAKNSCSAQWAAFGVPVESCAQPVQFNSVRPPLREPQRRHGTSKCVYGRTAPRSLGPRLEYCARMSRQGDAFSRIG